MTKPSSYRRQVRILTDEKLEELYFTLKTRSQLFPTVENLEARRAIRRELGKLDKIDFAVFKRTQEQKNGEQEQKNGEIEAQIEACARNIRELRSKTKWLLLFSAMLTIICFSFSLILISNALEAKPCLL